MIICISEPNRIRSLFTRDALGITSYISDRDLEFKYTQSPEEFKVEFDNCIRNTLPPHIVISDLKRYLHLMDDSPNDLNLLQRGLRFYWAQRYQMESRGDDLSTNYYEFGPLVMRALYHFEQLDRAIQVM